MTVSDLQASAETKAESIFSRRLLVEERAEIGPLLAVGLPRSGSSFFADLVSRSGACYCFDDLYFQRHVEKIGTADGPLEGERLESALHFLGWQIRARLRWKNYALPRMGEDDVEPMNDALRAAFGGRAPHWSVLQEEWLRRLARLNGARGWGYNQPGAFLSLESLTRFYPNARIAFLFRAPEKVLASFKHMEVGHRDGHPHQYHPLPYALYWRKAVEAYERWSGAAPKRVTAVRFEEMIADPHGAAARLAAFFGAPASEIEGFAEANTSFRTGVRTLTGLETAILRRVAGPAAERLGYRIPAAPGRAADVADLVATSLRFGLHQFRTARRDEGRRRQIRRLLGLSRAPDC